MNIKTMAERHLESDGEPFGEMPPENPHCPVCKTRLEEIEVCAECGDPDAHELGAGDESWTVCDACRGIEQGYKKALWCDFCCEVVK